MKTMVRSMFMNLNQISFRGSGAPLTGENLAAVEEKLHIRFPEDYADFLRKVNGGIPEQEQLFDFYDSTREENNTSVIRRFFKIYTEPYSRRVYDDIVQICQIMRREETIGTDTVAIADDPGGNVICLCVAGENCGKVYFGNHEFEDEDTGYLWMDEIAPSFRVFLEALYPNPEE